MTYLFSLSMIVCSVCSNFLFYKQNLVEIYFNLFSTYHSLLLSGLLPGALNLVQ